MAAHLTVPDEGITRFTEFGLSHNPQLRLLVQASWYPFDVPGDDRIRANPERDDMEIADLQAAVDEWRTRLETHVDELNERHERKAVFITPVGDAVVKLRAMVVDGTYPGVASQSELFTDPIGHAGAHIQALAAYCNFAAIYRVSPEGLDARNRDLSEEQRSILQKLAWDTVSRYSHAGVAVVEDNQAAADREENEATAQAEDAIDFNRARELLRRSQGGESLTDEEQEYLRRARESFRPRQTRNSQRSVNERIVSGETTGFTPLTEMSADDEYHGEDGGLYGAGRNTPPDSHRMAAELELAQIQPLNAAGEPADDGRIVLISISMSNATQEFSVFKRIADADSDKTVRPVDNRRLRPGWTGNGQMGAPGRASLATGLAPYSERRCDP